MIINIKQRKIQIEPKTKLNYNISNRRELLLTGQRTWPHVITRRMLMDHVDRVQ